MKFAHLADNHLGGWRQPELQELNMQAFRKAIDTCIEEEVEFILFAGDLFDSAFPPIETLKEAFHEFRRLKDIGIRCYVIAGSHDYSVSGKTFLDVLEKAGFCEICKYDYDIETDKIVLRPIIHKSYYIYGYPGKKSGLEVQDLKKIEIREPYSDNFRILMLHTTLKEVAGNLPIECITLDELPKSDYYAMGHIHVDFEQEKDGKPVIYGGPTFPNNFKELDDLGGGRFYIIEVEGYTKITKKEIKLKEIVSIEVEIIDSFKGTEIILNELEKKDLNDKIVLLKVQGILEQGKTSDIKFQEIEDYIRKAGAYCYLKNTSKLEVKNEEIEIKLESNEMEKVEEVLVKKYELENKSTLNELIFQLMDGLSMEKQEDEKSTTFESRLFLELNKIFDIELI